MRKTSSLSFVAPNARRLLDEAPMSRITTVPPGKHFYLHLVQCLRGLWLNMLEKSANHDHTNHVWPMSAVFMPGDTCVATDERLVREASTLILSGAGSRTTQELAHIVSLFASSDGWIDRVRLRAEGRWYERLYQGPDHDVWLISWLPGQSTGFHDHGESSGAFVVATGILEEHRPGEQALKIHPGQARAFGPDYAHDVRNVSPAPAVSIHAYSPPLK